MYAHGEHWIECPGDWFTVDSFHCDLENCFSSKLMPGGFQLMMLALLSVPETSLSEETEN